MSDGDRLHNISRLERELGSLPLPGACDYYANYINNFQNSAEMAASFLNRMAPETREHNSPGLRRLMDHAARWCAWLSPLETGAQALAATRLGSREAATAVEVLNATNAEPELFAKLQEVHFSIQADEVREVAADVLARNPMYALMADMLLNVDYFQGRLPDPRLEAFRCPKVIRPLWNLRLFRHLAALGDVERAVSLWDDAYEVNGDPVTLNLAAELFRKAGNLERCLNLYERSLAVDPLQHPVVLRLRELCNPFRPVHRLVEEKRVCIYLYCYNKAQSLAETLESLAGCRIGPARLKILLNGCTDGSAAVARRAVRLFPDNEVEIIELPVNIGAPAARNWLISQPATWESDYVTFLDDDVELQPDWLAHFLTVAEADPGVANVGCKVVFPSRNGAAPQIQYLYRYVSVANKQLVRVSLPTPDLVYDTGFYDVVRPTRVVMGCQHMMRVSALKEVPWFDIRYSPSQVDDTDHDLQFCLKGHRVAYCGTVTCVHKHSSGSSLHSGFDYDRLSNVNGNDVKFHYKYMGKLEEMARLDSLSLND